MINDPAYILRCYYQSSRALLSLGTGGYTYLWSCVAINSFTEALATILSNCLYKSHLTIFWSRVGFEPRTSGRRHLSPCIYAKPLTYQSRYGKRDKNLIPKPDLMISDPHIHSDVITRAVGFAQPRHWQVYIFMKL